MGYLNSHPNRTVTARLGFRSHPGNGFSGEILFGRLKGRAWISRDNSEILHLEVNLIEGLPALSLRGGAISIDYAPITMKSRSVSLWLPEHIAAFWEFKDHQVMLVHSFKEFKVFAVETEERIQEPKEN